MFSFLVDGDFAAKEDRSERIARDSDIFDKK
jgi:hypothetical protein